MRTGVHPNARLTATGVHRCDEGGREPDDEPESGGVDDDTADYLV